MTDKSATHNNGSVPGCPTARLGMSCQKSNESKPSNIGSQKFWTGITSWRARMALHMHTLILLIVLLRMNMPIALVCMLQDQSSSVNTSLFQAALVSEDNSSSASRGLESGQGNATNAPEVDRRGQFSRNGSVSEVKGEFDWDSTTQGLIISSGNLLGFILPLIIDWVSRKVGAKRLIFWSTAGSALLTLLHPIGARQSAYMLITLRLGIGLLGGVALPIITEVFSWWAPQQEKVTMISLAFAGINVGNIIAGVTCGYLCAVPIDNGWPFIFYVQGALCLVWCLLWQLTGSLRPEDHPFVSEDEKLYIMRTRLAMDTSQKKTSPPYKTILTSVPVWGFLGAMAVHFITTILFFSYLPIYLSDVFQISIETVGLLSSVGSLVRFLGVIMWGQISNLLMRKTNLSTTACRKIAQCTGFYICAASLFGLSFVRHQVAAVVLVYVIMLMQGAAGASGMILPLDMAPRYAGLLTGLFTATGSALLLPGPIIVSLGTQNGTAEEWRLVFLTFGALFFAGSTCFLCLASAKLQSWALPPKSSEEAEMSDPQITAEMMRRRMTVMSAGPPQSPSANGKRMTFSMSISPPGGEQIPGSADHQSTQMTSPHSHPNHVTGSSIYTIGTEGDQTVGSSLESPTGPTYNDLVKNGSVPEQESAGMETKVITHKNPNTKTETPKSEKNTEYNAVLIKRRNPTRHDLPYQLKGSCVNPGFQPDGTECGFYNASHEVGFDNADETGDIVVVEDTRL